MIDHNGNNNSNKRRKRAIDKIAILEEPRRVQRNDTSARTNQHPQKAHNMNSQVEVAKRCIGDKGNIGTAERGGEDKEEQEGLTNLKVSNRNRLLAGSRSNMCQRTANPQRRCTSPKKAKEMKEAKRRNPKRKRDPQHIQPNNTHNNKRPDSYSTHNNNNNNNNNSHTSHRIRHKKKKSYTDNSPRYIPTRRPFSCKELSMG